MSNVIASEAQGWLSHMARRITVGPAVVLVAGGLLCAPMAAQEAMPVVDITLAADPLYVQEDALFGSEMALGKLRGPADPRVAVVVCAPLEDYPGFMNSGAAYVFEDHLLLPPGDKVSRLLPSAPANGLQLGDLDVAIDNIRGLDGLGAPFSNLIMIGCFGRTALYPHCGRAIVGAGSVEIYDFNNPIFNGEAFSLVAPLNPGTCPSAAPAEVGAFGLAIAVGDINRDGIKDLIVGAPATDVVAPGDGLGRVYAFGGRDDFVPPPGLPGPYPPNAWQNWVAIDAPLDDVGSNFGASIDTAEISEDGIVDVVVGRPDKSNRAPTGSPQGGGTYVFRGAWLESLWASDSVVTPPVVEGIEWHSCSPAYQRLLNPFGNLPSGTGDWFGYQVFAVGDVGSPASAESPNVSGPPDGIPDIVVHGDGTNYINDSGDPVEPNSAGGSFVYFGRRDTGPPCPGQLLVDPNYFLLQRPPNVGLPLQGDRFGRACVGIDLFNPLTGLVERGLIVGALGTPPYFPGNGGEVFLFRGPFLRSSNGTPITLNAWGTTALVEPVEPHIDHYFGCSIVAGDYLGTHKTIPGQQFVVAAREATAEDVLRAGQAYSFVPAGGP